MHGYTTAPQEAEELTHELRLVHARLGPVAAIYHALRAKHAPTAAHSLRVAFVMSAWGSSLSVEERDLELMELGGLLHDLGKLAVPDRILLKVGELSPDELAIVVSRHQVGVDILRAAGGSHELLQTVASVPMYFRDYGRSQPLAESVTLAAQMMAIADAYDSMTNEQVYRVALSKYQAFDELNRYSGTQFNPDLVKHFIQHINGIRAQDIRSVQKRWIHALDLQQDPAHFRFQISKDQQTDAAQQSLANIFHFSLMDNMREGVVCVDWEGRIVEWNRAAEKLTGLSRSMVLSQVWSPTVMSLADDRGSPLCIQDCPLQQSLSDGSRQTKRLQMQSKDQRQFTIDVTIVPLFDSNHVLRGASMIFGDATDRVSLEERVQDLHARATIDPLTRVFNRAELDRRLSEALEQARMKSVPLSIIVTDIDYFKRVNDTFGHSAGDEALRMFASILKKQCRGTDIVARFGGEEFVILCPDCEMANAVERAESLRLEFAALPISVLRGSSITASFGVTEAHYDDTEETLFERADQALLMAKEGGRNLVVRLSPGESRDNRVAPVSWMQWLGLKPVEPILEGQMLSNVPIDVTVEKLKGFVSDCKAEILSVKKNLVVIRLDCKNVPQARRRDDRPPILQLEVTLDEVHFQTKEGQGQKLTHTLLGLVVRPTRQRDRRIGYVAALADRVRNHLLSYLGAVRVNEELRAIIEQSRLSPIEAKSVEENTPSKS